MIAPLVAAAAFALPPAVQAGELVRLPTRAKVVALTLDGGADARGATAVLRTLRRERVAATFFLTGRFVRRYPLVARAIGRDFPVGNHTISHSQMTRLASSEVRREIVVAARQIERATRRDPRPLFRFPYGDRDARTLRIARSLGYVSIRWTVDTLGWMPGQTVGGAVNRVVNRLVPGAILLLHLGGGRDGAAVDTRALPRVIAAIRARGYRFVTLESVRAP